MTDRDALIERVTTLVDRAHGVATVVVYVVDLKALISLASPSPAQWPEDVVERAKSAMRIWLPDVHEDALGLIARAALMACVPVIEVRT